jgi:formate hydrogenlyase subunit 6/NADH:ubiquinone oxidoreductase subunit I
MAEKYIIKHELIFELLNREKDGGTRIIAPVNRNEKLIFEVLNSTDEIVTDYIQTEMSAKFAVFPKYEEILHYTFIDGDIRIEDEKDTSVPTIVYGTRPCDAGSFAVLDAVFMDGHDDMFYCNRRKQTAVISLSCSKADKNCFCTSVGISPGDTAGSDILLTDTGNGEYLAEILTSEGERLISPFKDKIKTADGVEKEKYLADVPEQFNVDNLLKITESSFDNPVYLNQSLRCLGCGVCSYVCPSCSCFDIQDEVVSTTGVRIRCWDSCGFSHFTLHTSWHNPRSMQGKRWRQRIMHKFYYQPDTLKVIGCVGCGRCSRACPADMNIIDHLKTISEL